MDKVSLNSPYFTDETKAREYLEKIRWPSGVVCPKCGNMEKVYRLQGKKCRPGLYKCGDCRKQFTVMVGTLFERSKIPLHKWLTAVYLLSASKKGISSHQLHRILGVTYKTAWFMTHRIRKAMKDPVFTSQLSGPGTVVEADETFWGNKGKQRKGARGYHHKEKIFSLVERGGKVRSFHVPTVAGKTLKPIMREQIHKDTAIMTDDMGSYAGLDREFASHDVVRHSANEYVRGQIYTNTVENYFSILKRGLVGVYQHVGANHLRKSNGEFDFRYNHRDLSDIERTEVALAGIQGKRLLYRDSSQ
ncbi:MAG: IS1595 family transposase [Deltaproteobacteria bacterium]|nr:IS1595 family transposase [Deltaproteobacteria bacterium]